MYSSSYQGLGFWAALATVTATAWNAYQETSGTGGCARGFNKLVPPGTECPGTPDYDAVSRAFQKATDAEIGAILTVLKASNDGKGPSSRADLLNPGCLPRYVKAMMGGGDCRATKFPEQPQMLFDLVAKYGAPETEEDMIPGSGILHAAASPAGGIAVALALGAAFILPAILGGKKRGR